MSKFGVCRTIAIPDGENSSAIDPNSYPKIKEVNLWMQLRNMNND